MCETSMTRARFFEVAAMGILVALGPGCGGSEAPAGVPASHAVSGQVSGAVASGVTVALGGAATATTTTGSSGEYAFAGLADGSYTVTPSLAGYTFSPTSRAVAVSGASVDGQDFAAATGAPPPLTVSDGDFGSWSPFSFVTGYPGLPPGPGTSVGRAFRAATGGHPDAYYDVSLTIASAHDTCWSGGIKTDYTYDPAIHGAITSLSVAVDLIQFQRLVSSMWHLVIEQGGVRYYSSPPSNYYSTSWSRESNVNLAAADFDTNPWAFALGSPPDGNRPDFGVAAPPLRFGLVVGNQYAVAAGSRSSLGLDDFSLTIKRQ